MPRIQENLEAVIAEKIFQVEREVKQKSRKIFSQIVSGLKPEAAKRTKAVAGVVRRVKANYEVANEFAGENIGKIPKEINND